MQQLLQRELHPSRSGRRNPLSANALCFRMLPVLSECSFERSGSRYFGSGDFCIRRQKTLRGMRTILLLQRQPGEILRGLQGGGVAKAEGGIRQKKTRSSRKIELKRSRKINAFRVPIPAGWYLGIREEKHHTFIKKEAWY